MMWCFSDFGPVPAGNPFILIEAAMLPSIWLSYLIILLLFSPNLARYEVVVQTIKP